MDNSSRQSRTQSQRSPNLATTTADWEDRWLWVRDCPVGGTSTSWWRSTASETELSLRCSFPMLLSNMMYLLVRLLSEYSWVPALVSDCIKRFGNSSSARRFAKTDTCSLTDFSHFLIWIWSLWFQETAIVKSIVCSIVAWDQASREIAERELGRATRAERCRLRSRPRQRSAISFGAWSQASSIVTYF